MHCHMSRTPSKFIDLFHMCPNCNLTTSTGLQEVAMIIAAAAAPVKCIGIAAPSTWPGMNTWQQQQQQRSHQLFLTQGQALMY